MIVFASIVATLSIIVFLLMNKSNRNRKLNNKIRIEERKQEMLEVLKTKNN